MSIRKQVQESLLYKGFSTEAVVSGVPVAEGVLLGWVYSNMPIDDDLATQIYNFCCPSNIMPPPEMDLPSSAPTKSHTRTIDARGAITIPYRLRERWGKKVTVHEVVDTSGVIVLVIAPEGSSLDLLKDKNE